MSALNFVRTVAKMTTSATWPFPTAEDYGFTSADNVSWPELPEVNKVNITHCMGPKGKGGVTIAWRKASDTKNARMVEVAVTYCSPADTFTKKIGKEAAMLEFQLGNTILVPARTMKSDDTIPYNLREMFWYSIQD